MVEVKIKLIETFEDLPEGKCLHTVKTANGTIIKREIIDKPFTII